MSIAEPPVDTVREIVHMKAARAQASVYQLNQTSI